MRVEGMSAVGGAIGKLAAVVALVGGLALTSPAQADSWKDALRDADDLHEAAEELHQRAVRLHDHHTMPVTAALDHAAAHLYHGLKHEPCAAEIVPLLNQTEAMLRETSAVMALSCALHTDRKAIALLRDAQHHFADTAEHIECVLHDHHDHHSRHPAPTVRYPQPRPSWSPSPYGTHYAPPPAWLGQPASPAVWGSSYRGASQGHDYHNQGHHKNRHNKRSVDEHHHHTSAGVHADRPLPRVLISGISVR